MPPKIIPSQIKRQNRYNSLLDTRHRFQDKALAKVYLEKAKANHARWKEDVAQTPSLEQFSNEAFAQVRVISGDWGDVTLDMSKRYGGQIFAVLNMANAYRPWKGDGYSGTQEENMAYRTNLSQAMTEVDGLVSIPESQPYPDALTDLINGEDGEVYLDVDNPRICIKGNTKPDGTHDDLDKDNYFLFYELRAAANDLSDGSFFDDDLMRKKIQAQLDTLIKKKIRHVVLGAFGCGNFRNPPGRVAELYREELALRMHDFDVVTFAIYETENSKNYEPFFQALNNRQPKAEFKETQSKIIPVSFEPFETQENSPSNRVCFNLLMGVAALGAGALLIGVLGLVNVVGLGLVAGVALSSVGGLLFFGGGMGLALKCCTSQEEHSSDFQPLLS